MKKIIRFLTALLLAAALCACGQAPAADSTAAPADKTFTVGICQLTQHVALDAATKGFRDALEKALPGRVSFKEQNASNEPANCSTIINGFIADNVDLILANATPALTAAASATDTIPILGTAVTAYGVALDIPDFNGTVGGNISGTSDLADLHEQAAMVKEWFPDAKNVGLLFCSAEANSRYQVDEIGRALTALGYSCTEFAFTDTNDLAAVTQNAADKSDVIYIPTDNTAANNVESIANILIPAKVPAVCGEEGICAGCGVCTLSISYYDLGVTTGEMAARILTGEADISSVPVAYTNAAKKYNQEFCDQLGLTVPEGYEAIEK